MVAQDAKDIGLPVGRFWTLVWRNWRASGRKLEMIPPYPRTAEDAAKESAK